MLVHVERWIPYDLEKNHLFSIDSSNWMEMLVVVFANEILTLMEFVDGGLDAMATVTLMLNRFSSFLIVD